MKRTVSTSATATILPMRPAAPAPTIVRFPRPSRNVPLERARRSVSAIAAASSDNSENALSQVRDRLLRMIVDNERNRTHGNRAS